MRITQYETYPSDNLITAYNNVGKRIHLDYNNKAQIIQAKSENMVMSFTHNDLGQFETISVEGFGTTKITHGADGNIQEFTNTDSRENLNIILQALPLLDSIERKKT